MDKLNLPLRLLGPKLLALAVLVAALLWGAWLTQQVTTFGHFVERTGLRLENPDGGLTDNLPTIQRWLR